jgi:hypothetical protein
MKIDQTALRAYYGNDPLTRAMVDYLNERKRVPDAMSLDVLLDVAKKANVEASREDAMATLKALANTGAARLLMGRRGHATRVRFDLGAKLVATVANGTFTLPESDVDNQEGVPAPESTNVVDLPVQRRAFELASLKSASAEELRRVIAYANTLLELNAIENGVTPAVVSRGRRLADKAGR